jgi:hypothetical protein
LSATVVVLMLGLFVGLADTTLPSDRTVSLHLTSMLLLLLPLLLLLLLLLSLAQDFQGEGRS